MSEWTMQTLYLACAVGGGGLLAIQLVFLIFGGDADVDTDAGFEEIAGGEGAFKLVSLMSLAAFVTFFGLTGMFLGGTTDWHGLVVVLVSSLVGLVVMSGSSSCRARRRCSPPSAGSTPRGTSIPAGRWGAPGASTS
jgi:hypothetical protein